MEKKRQVLVFAIEDQRYALELSVVERVVRAVEVKPLPKAPPVVVGVINVQGLILPVLDIRKRFRQQESSVGVNDRFVIVRLSGKKLAFVVSAVIGIMECPEEKMTSFNSILPGTGYIEGILKLGGDMVLVHDPEYSLNPEEGKVSDDVTEQS